MVGAGVQADRLSGDGGAEPLAGSLATVSGAHFTPVVSLAAWRTGEGVRGREAAAHTGAAYWLTSSIGFADPGRAFTYAGIAPALVVPFIAAGPGRDPVPRSIRWRPTASSAVADRGSPAREHSRSAARSHGAVRLRAQRGPLPDGRRFPHPPDRRPRSGPLGRVDPAVVEARKEAGVDISAEIPKVLTIEAVQVSDVVITMGCGDACPILPGKRYEDWRLGQDVVAVRPIRDEIEARVRVLIGDLLPGATPDAQEPA